MGQHFIIIDILSVACNILKENLKDKVIIL